MPTKDTIKNDILMKASALHKHRRQMLQMLEGFETRAEELRQSVRMAEEDYECDMEATETYVRAALRSMGADVILDIDEMKGLFPTSRKKTMKKVQPKQTEMSS